MQVSEYEFCSTLRQSEILRIVTYILPFSSKGLMMSANSLIRAFFLVVLFPRIIKGGRRFLSSPRSLPPSPPSQPTITPLPVEASEFDPPHIPDEVFEPVAAPKPTTLSHGSAFDLHFLRISLILDGLITSAVALSTKGFVSTVLRRNHLRVGLKRARLD